MTGYVLNVLAVIPDHDPCCVAAPDELRAYVLGLLRMDNI